MKKIIFTAISVFAVTAFIACSADTIATGVDAIDKTGPTGIVGNQKDDKVVAPNKKQSSSSRAKSSSSSSEEE